MLKKDLLLRNPLRRLGPDPDTILPKGGFGAVCARAGVGKTSFLVQIALNCQLDGQNILHVSLVDPVRKVDLWYREVFHRLADYYRVQQLNQLWEAILPQRFIMTFRAESFTVPVLEERLGDLTEQDIFHPRVVIVDGFSFDDAAQESLSGLKEFATANDLRIWFSVRTHRHEPPGEDGLPIPLAPVFDLFEAAIELQPEGKTIRVRDLRQPANDTSTMFLDPSTMLITGE